MKAFRGYGVKTLYIVDLSTRQRSVVSFTLQFLLPLRKESVMLFA
jgi:hypothetical protein